MQAYLSTGSPVGDYVKSKRESENIEGLAVKAITSNKFKLGYAASSEELTELLSSAPIPDVFCCASHGGFGDTDVDYTRVQLVAGDKCCVFSMAFFRPNNVHSFISTNTTSNISLCDTSEKDLQGGRYRLTEEKRSPIMGLGNVFEEGHVIADGIPGMRDLGKSYLSGMLKNSFYLPAAHVDIFMRRHRCTDQDGDLCRHKDFGPEKCTVSVPDRPEFEREIEAEICRVFGDVNIKLRGLNVCRKGGSYDLRPNEAAENSIGTLLVFLTDCEDTVEGSDGNVHMRVEHYGQSQPFVFDSRELQIERENIDYGGPYVYVAYRKSSKITIDPPAETSKLVLIYDIFPVEKPIPSEILMAHGNVDWMMRHAKAREQQGNRGEKDDRIERRSETVHIGCTSGVIADQSANRDFAMEISAVLEEFAAINGIRPDYFDTGIEDYYDGEESDPEQNQSARSDGTAAQSTKRKREVGRANRPMKYPIGIMMQRWSESAPTKPDSLVGHDRFLYESLTSLGYRCVLVPVLINGESKYKTVTSFTNADIKHINSNFSPNTKPEPIIGETETYFIDYSGTYEKMPVGYTGAHFAVALLVDMFCPPLRHAKRARWFEKGEEVLMSIARYDVGSKDPGNVGSVCDMVRNYAESEDPAVFHRLLSIIRTCDNPVGFAHLLREIYDDFEVFSYEYSEEFISQILRAARSGARRNMARVGGEAHAKIAFQIGFHHKVDLASQWLNGLVEGHVTREDFFKILLPMASIRVNYELHHGRVQSETPVEVGQWLMQKFTRKIAEIAIDISVDLQSPPDFSDENASTTWRRNVEELAKSADSSDGSEDIHIWSIVFSNLVSGVLQIGSAMGAIPAKFFPMEMWEMVDLSGEVGPEEKERFGDMAKAALREQLAQVDATWSMYKITKLLAHFHSIPSGCETPAAVDSILSNPAVSLVFLIDLFRSFVTGRAYRVVPHTMNDCSKCDDWLGYSSSLKGKIRPRIERGIDISDPHLTITRESVERVPDCDREAVWKFCERINRFLVEENEKKLVVVGAPSDVLGVERLICWKEKWENSPVISGFLDVHKVGGRILVVCKRSPEAAAQRYMKVFRFISYF